MGHQYRSVRGDGSNLLSRVENDERDLVFQGIRADGDPDQSRMQYDYDPNKNFVRKRTPRALGSFFRIVGATPWRTPLDPALVDVEVVDGQPPPFPLVVSSKR